MRLINADKLKTEMLLNKTSQEISDVDERQNDVIDWCIKDVDDAPTVKAIPIEWIKGYITPFQVHHDSLSEELKENDGAGWVVDILETMLREWEKENEVN